MNLMKKIGLWVTETHFDELSESVIQDVKRAFWDTVGVIVAGANEPVSTKVYNYVKNDRAQGEVTVFTKGHKFYPPSASVVNATMAHALDFDDAELITKCHSSAVLVPAIMAVGEHLDSSGKDLITAYVIGLEVMTKLNTLLGTSHYESGWHSTSTLGAFGATAAASKLYGLSASQIENAFGITASKISGLRKNFGTMTKPLHCGFAAETGISSAILASQGFTANKNIFEGNLSFFSLYGKSNDFAKVERLSFENPSNILSCNLHIKRYPSCLGTHRAADVILDYFLKDFYFEPSDILEIQCIGSRGSFAAVIHDEPTTGLEGKFSIQYVIAAALKDKKIDIDSFSDEMVQRPEIQEIMSRIKKIEKPSGKIGGDDKKFTIVEIKMKSGRIIEKMNESAKGSPVNPLSDEQLMEKYTYCTKHLFSKDQIEDTSKVFNSLEDLGKISDLIGLFRW